MMNKEKTLEELYKMRNELLSAYMIQKHEYQIHQIEEINREIDKRMCSGTLYDLKIRDIETNITIKMTIEGLMELRDILKGFETKTIEVELVKQKKLGGKE